jgi:uncharacterized protein YndB with AHSA1/START domain
MKIKMIETKMKHITRRAARPIIIACLVAFAFAATAAHAAAGEPIWKKIDRAQLVKLIEGGRVGFVDRGLYPGKEMAVSGIIINAKPEQVWDVLVDFDRYPKMINQISKVEVIEKNDKFARLHFYMFIIKLGPVKVQTNYFQKWTFDKPRKITMTLEDESSKKKKEKETPITWELVPTPDGKRTMLFHTTISNMRDGGMIGAYMVDRQPTIQIGFDLANALTQTEAIKDQIENKK